MVLNEYGIVLEAQFFRRAVQSKVYGSHGDAEITGVSQLKVLLRYNALVAHIEYVVGYNVGYDLGGIQLLAVGHNACNAAVLIIEEFCYFAVEAHFSAVFDYHINKGQRKLMGAMAGHCGAVHNVIMHHVKEVHCVQLVSGHSKIAPIGVDYVLGSLGYAESGHHLLNGVAGHPHKVGVFGQHCEAIGFALHSVYIGDCRVYFGLKGEEGPYVFLTAGHGIIHALTEFLNACLEHQIVVFRLVYYSEDVMLIFPVYLGAKLVQHLVYGVWLFRCANAAQFMERRLKLKPSPAEAGGAAAGQIMLFQQQRLQACFGGIRCSGKSAVSSANHYNVVFVVHDSPPLLIFKEMYILSIAPLPMQFKNSGG